MSQSLGLFVIILGFSASSQAAVTVDLTGTELYSKLSAERKLIVKDDPKKASAVLRSMKVTIVEAEKVSSQLDPEKSRAYRFTVHGLSHYFQLMAEMKLNREECEKTKNMILVQGSPDGKGVELTGDAIYSVETLKLACQTIN